MSFLRDVKIFFKTIGVVLFGKNNHNLKKAAAKSAGHNIELMYITNDPMIAQVAEDAGVNIIFIDIEGRDKWVRQKGRDSVISIHSLPDISAIRPLIKRAKLLVRINSVYDGTKAEIDEAVNSGANIIMLPYFKTLFEVEEFLRILNRRAKAYLLLETAESVNMLDDILKLKGIDAIHIGLNDLHLSYNRKFMFELLADNTVENIIKRIKPSGIKYGFGGIASLGSGLLPSELIIAEHHRLGSSMAILSRSFYDIRRQDGIETLKYKFYKGISEIRDYELVVQNYTDNNYAANSKILRNKVEDIVCRL